MTPIQKIRTSFTNQLTLWVAGFVLVTSGIVIFLLLRFSEGVIHDETVDATMQVLENTALRIDNTLRQTEMTARLEHQQIRMNRSRIEELIEKNGSLATLRQSLAHAQIYVTRRDSVQFDSFITGGESGYRQMTYDGNQVYIFSQPIGTRQYCLVAVCPAEDIYGKYSRMQWVLKSWSIATVLLLILLLYLVIARHLRPLHRLADSAQAIAQGHLDTPIPDTRHRDETGRLQKSLSQMQRKLMAYMDEMHQKRDTLNRQHAELQAAYDDAQAYEEKKARFLHDMTDRMAAPVDQLCKNTEAICRDYPNISKTDMTALQTDILQESETITELLDQLIKDPANS